MPGHVSASASTNGGHLPQNGSLTSCTWCPRAASARSTASYCRTLAGVRTEKRIRKGLFISADQVRRGRLPRLRATSHFGARAALDISRENGWIFNGEQKA